MGNSFEEAKAAFFEDLGLSLEQIKKTIDDARDHLQALIAHGRDVRPLVKKLKEALKEAQKLRSKQKPDSPAYFGYDRKDRGVLVEESIEGLIEFVEGIDDRQRQVMGGKYKTNRVQYTQKGKASWMDRYLALIAANFCAEKRNESSSSNAAIGVTAAGIFFYLRYEIGNLKLDVPYQEQVLDSVERLRITNIFFQRLKDAREDMESDEEGIKASVVDFLTNDLEAKFTAGSCIDIDFING